MRARVFLLSLCACGGAQTEVTTPPVATVTAPPSVEEEEESAAGGAAHAQIGNVRVALDVYEDERERFSFEVTPAQARALGGEPRPQRALDFVDLVDEAYPLPSERVYEAVESEAQSACMNEDYDDEECVAESPRCYDRVAVVEDTGTGTVLAATELAFLCGDAYDEEGDAGVTTHDLEGGGSVFVIVWDDTEDDPGGRCGCNPEARTVHVAVLDAEGTVIFREDAGYQISTCPLGESDEYRVVWRDVDGDGAKELVGEIVLSFSPPEDDEYEETYPEDEDEASYEDDEAYEEETPEVRPWFVRSFATPALRTALASTTDRCMQRFVPPAPSPSPRVATPAVRRAPARRAARPPRQTLHFYANACECGDTQSCIDLSQAFRTLRKTAWADAAEERAVLQIVERCLERNPSDCLLSLDERELPSASRARARALLGGLCAERDALACLAAARMDFEDGARLDAAVPVLAAACEDGPVQEACEMLASRPGPEGIGARRMLCALGSYARCSVSTAEARASGRALTLREQTFDHVCPAAP